MRALLAGVLLAVALGGCNEDPSSGQINGACRHDGGAVYVHREVGAEGNGVYFERCRDGRVVAVGV
jgi:hypothetical protein